MWKWKVPRSCTLQQPVRWEYLSPARECPDQTAGAVPASRSVGLSGTYGRRLLLDWMWASCSCIARVARSASDRMRYARSQPAGAPSRAKCAGHCPGRAAGDAS
eukprot:4700893-Pleurochrysis_carterae.AAC.1